ncbi:MAG: hypothetical protein HY553_20065 [Elusimicrobia bacterium]|nr:hypothetical protein [Elusimicrobiota bacterium]
MATSEQRAQALYFVNAPVDFLLIGGLSIAAFLYLRLFYSGERTGDILTLALQLSWIGNWPHAAATNYRLYRSTENIRQYPLTALVIPWVMVAGIAGSFASPELFAPAFVKVAILWAPYHFAGQSIGISLIYARRAGFDFGAVGRWALSAFLYGLFVAQAVRYEAGLQRFDHYGLSYASLGIPERFGTIAGAWVALSGLAFLACVALRCRAERRLVPPIVLFPVLTHFVWFVPGARWASFGEFVPFFHGLQYLLIAWSMQLKEKLDREGLEPSRGYVLSETGRWGAMNFVVGAALFYGLPELLARFGAPLAFTTGIIASAVQIHHYFVDGVIWKLRQKSVSSPLMAGLDDLLRPPARPTTAAA